MDNKIRLIDANALKEFINDGKVCDICDKRRPRCEYNCDFPDYVTQLLEKVIDNIPTVDTTCPNCDSGYAQGYSDGYLKGKEERPIDLSEYSDKLWKKAYERGKAEERPQGEWIPVSERLPDLFEVVLVTDETNNVFEYERRPLDEEGNVCEKWTFLGRKVIAWMPLPEPYKEAENEDSN